MNWEIIIFSHLRHFFAFYRLLIIPFKQFHSEWMTQRWMFGFCSTKLSAVTSCLLCPPVPSSCRDKKTINFLCVAAKSGKWVSGEEKHKLFLLELIRKIYIIEKLHNLFLHSPASVPAHSCIDNNIIISCIFESTTSPSSGNIGGKLWILYFIISHFSFYGVLSGDCSSSRGQNIENSRWWNFFLQLKVFLFIRDQFSWIFASIFRFPPSSVHSSSGPCHAANVNQKQTWEFSWPNGTVI